MILTISLNPSIDRSYKINNFEKGKIFRTNEFQYTPGGKGLNVTKVIKSLDESVMATGLIGGRSGNFIKDRLDEMDIEYEFTSIKGETRSCLAILSSDGVQTEILEQGPYITHEELDNFYMLYDRLMDKAEIICASGSLPNGLSQETYKNLINKATKKGKRFILDTSGCALCRGMEAKPYLIKPNKEELEVIVGHTISSEKDIIKAARFLIDRGVQIVAISLGGEGALVFYKNHIYRINIPKVRVVNPVGSGDSMIAGFAVALNRNYDFEYMLKLAAACGTANSMETETGKVDILNINKLIDMINIVKIKL